MPEAPQSPRYPLCRQTVTLYHADPAAKAVRRTVVRGVFWDARRRAVPGDAGTQAGTGFLLLIPEAAARFGRDYTLAPGDRVLPGEGPAPAWADWPGFVPGAVPGLAVVQYIDQKTVGGVPCHLEAGGGWRPSDTGAPQLPR